MRDIRRTSLTRQSLSRCDMKAIVCVDSNWGIGKDNGLLVRIPADMKRFRQFTLGKTIIVGRKTVETFPNGEPLKGRRNIILSRDAHSISDIRTAGSRSDTYYCNSLDDALSLVTDREQTYVVGGASIYQLFLPYTNQIYVTRVEHAFEADAFFPNLDELNTFKMQNASEWIAHDGVRYRFEEWVREE